MSEVERVLCELEANDDELARWAASQVRMARAEDLFRASRQERPPLRVDVDVNKQPPISLAGEPLPGDREQPEDDGPFEVDTPTGTMGYTSREQPAGLSRSHAMLIREAIGCECLRSQSFREQLQPALDALDAIVEAQPNQQEPTE